MDELISQAPEIIAVIGGITALFVAWANVKKIRAEAAKLRQEAEARRRQVEIEAEKAKRQAEIDRDKAIAEANKAVVNAAAAAVNNLVDPLNNRVDQLEKALEDLTFEYYRLYLVVIILTDQLEENGVPPLVRHEELEAWDNKDLTAIAKERGIKLPGAVRRYSR